jgi:hypothetical protein
MALLNKLLRKTPGLATEEPEAVPLAPLDRKWLPVRAGALSQVEHVAHGLWAEQCRASGGPLMRFSSLRPVTQDMYRAMARWALGYVLDFSVSTREIWMRPTDGIAGETPANG